MWQSAARSVWCWTGFDREGNLSVILVTHDLGVMSAIADRVSIFYAGRVVESGPREDVLQRPRHPYTRALLDALPHPEAARDRPLVAIDGAPPPRAASRPAALSPALPVRPRRSAAQEVPLVGRRRRPRLACPVDPFAGT